MVQSETLIEADWGNLNAFYENHILIIVTLLMIPAGTKPK
jgi:hypothetical protein